jgi:hypothetical protein
MVCVISGAAHSMCMGWFLRVHRGALCGVGLLQFVLQQSRWVCSCCALRVRALALLVSERSGLCRMLVRVMLGGLFGLLRLLSVGLVWVLVVFWSSGKGIHARSMCSRARLAKRCSRLLVCETGTAMSLQRGTSAGVGSLRKTVWKFARKAVSSTVVAWEFSAAIKLFRI